ncbi:MAG: hypothetical protein KF914_03060 [Rhizobiaceae bacterium]|nr:hypothetical protein [Rhizobiaceae bacterium]
MKAGVTIGRFTIINGYTKIHDGTTIGRYCSVGKYCEIGTFDPVVDYVATSSLIHNAKAHFPDYADSVGKVKISRASGPAVGNDVWIGSHVSVRRGISIGNGAVVTSGAVVTHDVPPYAIVGGVPARLIRYRFPDDVIARLVASKWWDLPVSALKTVSFDDVEKALGKLAGKLDAPQSKPAPKPERGGKVVPLKRPAGKPASGSAKPAKTGDAPAAGGGSGFFEMLRQKLEERGVGGAVVEHVMANRARIFSGYDLGSVQDIVILNNKVDHIATLTSDRPADDGEPDARTLAGVLQILKSRH